MDADEPGWSIVDDFFHERACGRTPATVRKQLRVRAHLYAFMDSADMTLGLGSPSAARLDEARAKHADGAFWTLFGPVELLRCLPSFVHDVWLPSGAAQARAQVSATAGLVEHLARQVGPGGEDAVEALHHAREAVVHAQRRVAEPSAPSDAPQRMPARFLQGRGPEW